MAWYWASSDALCMLQIALSEHNIEDIAKAAKEAALHDTVMDFEHGYGTVIGERGVTLYVGGFFID